MTNKFSMWSVAGLMMVTFIGFQACSKKQVKDDQDKEIEESDIKDPTGKYGKVEVGFSGKMRMINFEYDKFGLTKEGRDILKKNAEWLLANKNVDVQVEGHCDSRGTEQYNLALGQKRADMVRSYLVDLGVPSKRLATLSYGEEKPLDAAESEDAWSLNRRAEFIITDK